MPAVDRSIFRINRDTRFSRDKSPYKTHSDMWFWIGDDRKGSPGYFVRIVPEGVWVGGGAHWLDPPRLARLRSAIVAPASGGELEATSRRADRCGLRDWASRTLARVPAGFSADSPRAELLRFTVMHAIVKVEPVPAEFDERGVRGVVHGAVRAGEAARGLARRQRRLTVRRRRRR